MPVSFLDEIQNLKQKTHEKIPKETVEELVQITDEMVKQSVDKNTLREGDQIPNFELTDTEGNIVKSSELLKKGPLVISFYRGGWCSFCSLELRFLQSIYPDVKGLGAQIMAISPQISEYSKSTKEDNNIEFYVLNDLDNKISKSFGLIFELIKNIANLYRLNFDLDLKAINGNEDYEFPIPATYVVNQEGRIHYAFIDADYMNRLEPEVLLNKLKELTGQS